MNRDYIFFKRIVFYVLICAGICSLISSLVLFIKGLQILGANFLIFFAISIGLSVIILQSDRSILDSSRRRIFKRIFPPFLSVLIGNIFRKVDSKRYSKELLFDGNEDLFFECLNDCEIYGEYGVGSSTKEAINMEKIIYSVDSDEAWINSVYKGTKLNQKASLKFIDLGITEAWGYPVSYKKRKNIASYLNFIWKQKYKPDFVLIDGRFRVASFLTSIKFCDDGCKIIFDDYANRPHYHVVEEIIKPIKIFGNQALFEIKDRNSLQENEIDQLLTSFEHVRD